MPHIIVTAGPTEQQGGTSVMLRERVNPADFESERFAANLVERLGWAVSDAIEAEQRQDDRVANGNGRQPVEDERADSVPEPVTRRERKPVASV
jgi:hypothetical protein